MSSTHVNNGSPSKSKKRSRRSEEVTVRCIATDQRRPKFESIKKRHLLSHYASKHSTTSYTKENVPHRLRGDDTNTIYYGVTAGRKTKRQRSTPHSQPSQRCLPALIPPHTAPSQAPSIPPPSATTSPSAPPRSDHLDTDQQPHQGRPLDSRRRPQNAPNPSRRCITMNDDIYQNQRTSIM